jgi:hypothetical protein
MSCFGNERNCFQVQVCQCGFLTLTLRLRVGYSGLACVSSPIFSSEMVAGSGQFGWIGARGDRGFEDKEDLIEYGDIGVCGMESTASLSTLKPETCELRVVKLPISMSS